MTCTEKNRNSGEKPALGRSADKWSAGNESPLMENGGNERRAPLRSRRFLPLVPAKPPPQRTRSYKIHEKPTGTENALVKVDSPLPKRALEIALAAPGFSNRPRQSVCLPFRRCLEFHFGTAQFLR